MTGRQDQDVRYWLTEKGEAAVAALQLADGRVDTDLTDPIDGQEASA